MFYELIDGKLTASQADKGVFAVFTIDDVAGVETFCNAEITQLKKINKYSTFLQGETGQLFIVNRAEEDADSIQITKIRFFQTADKVACLTDDTEKIVEIAQSLEGVSITTIVPMMLSELISDDNVYLELQEKRLAELEALFIKEKALYKSDELIKYRRKFLVLKRSYEQLLQCVSEAKKFAAEDAVTAFTELEETLSGLTEDLLNLRDFVSQVREAFQEQVDISLNTVMKFLTVVTSVFMPLSFIAGWYGMNLKMPEVKLEYGYLIPICLTIVISVVSVVYFVKKKWFR